MLPENNPGPCNRTVPDYVSLDGAQSHLEVRQRIEQRAAVFFYSLVMHARAHSDEKHTRPE